MMVQTFLDCLGAGFFTGVPDSQLKALCNYLVRTYGTNGKHMIAANEGNAVALAAGHYLATKEIPLVYMQNSGMGNAINPLVSLVDQNVYAVPMLLMMGVSSFAPIIAWYVILSVVTYKSKK